MKTLKSFKSQVILAIALTMLAYAILKVSGCPARVDLIVEGLLFTFAGFIGLKGFFKSGIKTTRNFRRFELFYGLTYSVVAIACIVGISYLVMHPQVYEIGLKHVKGSMLLQGMSVIKSLSFIFMFLAWFFFYRNLKLKAGILKQTLAFLAGFIFYFGTSIIIMSITEDSSIVSLGIIVGAAIGLFSIIALHKSTRLLSLIFFLFSTVHLWEFYLMGMHKDLVTGLNNPIYWLLIMLYTLEVNQWIKRKQFNVHPQN